MKWLHFMNYANKNDNNIYTSKLHQLIVFVELEYGAKIALAIMMILFNYNCSVK